MAQSFHYITPVSCNSDLTAGSYSDVDLDDYTTPSGTVTGVLLQIVNTAPFSTYSWFARKNGSTDDRYYDFWRGSHFFYACGVDASNIFEVKIENTSNINVYIIGYTTAGVTFDTNGTDVSLSTTVTWTDLSTLPTDSIGGIYNIYGNADFGFRKNGSTDNRYEESYYGGDPLAIIGCDGSQVVEGYIQNTDVDFWRVGYITDGATFHTNAIDRSLSTTGSYQDITLTTDATGGFIEVISSAAYSYALRKNGASYDYYGDAYRHPWAIVECDASYKIEGKIETTSVDFFEVGYSTAGGGATYDVSLTDGVDISDTPTGNSILNALASDGVDISDTPVGNTIYQLSLTDGCSLSDDGTVANIISVILSDGISVSDEITLQNTYNPIISDGVTISDITSILARYGITLSDGVSMCDSTSAGNIFCIELTDGITLNDTVALNTVFGVEVEDGVVLAEIIDFVNNRYVISLHLYTRDTSFTLQKRDFSLSLNTRSTSFTLQRR